MKKDAFREWIISKRTPRSASDCISRCRQVEESIGIDLDQEYEKDLGQSVLSILNYGRREANKGIPAPKQFSFCQHSNVVQRLCDLRCSVKQYFLFCADQSIKH